MAKSRKKQDSLVARTNATNSEIDNLIEGVNLYQNAGFFFAWSNHPLSKAIFYSTIAEAKERFAHDLAFVNEVFGLVDHQPLADATISLLKLAKNNREKKRKYLLELSDAFLAYMQTRK